MMIIMKIKVTLNKNKMIFSISKITSDLNQTSMLTKNYKKNKNELNFNFKLKLFIYTQNNFNCSQIV